MTLRLVTSESSAYLADGNGSEYAIVECNSPENVLRYLNRANLPILASAGVNTIYATLFGGDDRDCHPFVSRNSSILDPAKSAAWKSFIREWYALGDDHCWHALASEMECHTELTMDQLRALLAFLGDACGDRHVIVDFEEAHRDFGFWRPRLETIRADLPNAIRALHNQTSGTPAWADFRNTDLVQLLSVQASMQDAPGFAQQWLAEFANAGNPVCAYMSEITGAGFNPGSGPQFSQWALQSPLTCGAGAYYGGLDQANVDQEPYVPMYRHVTEPVGEGALYLNNGKCSHVSWQAVPGPLEYVSGRLALKWAGDWGFFATFQTRFAIPPLPAETYRIDVTARFRHVVGTPTYRLRLSSQPDWESQMAAFEKVGNGERTLSLVFLSPRHQQTMSLHFDVYEYETPVTGEVELVRVGVQAYG